MRRAIVGRHVRARRLARRRHHPDRDSATSRVRWRIDASGRTEPGKIQLVAGGDVELLAPLRAAANGLEADGAGRIDHRRRRRARQQPPTRPHPRRRRRRRPPAARSRCTAGRGVHLQNRISADGSDGGRLAISCRSGDITLARALDVSGVSATAAARCDRAAPATSPLLRPPRRAGLRQRGGTITLIAGGSITAFGPLRAGQHGAQRTGRHGRWWPAAATSRSADVVDADGRSGGQVSRCQQRGPARASGRRWSRAAGTPAPAARRRRSPERHVVIGQQVDADGGRAAAPSACNARIVITLTPAAAGCFARGDIGGTISARRRHGQRAGRRARARRRRHAGRHDHARRQRRRSRSSTATSAPAGAPAVASRAWRRATSSPAASSPRAATAASACPPAATLDITGGMFDVPVMRQLSVRRTVRQFER